MLIPGKTKTGANLCYIRVGRGGRDGREEGRQAGMEVVPDLVAERKDRESMLPTDHQ